MYSEKFIADGSEEASNGAEDRDGADADLGERLTVVARRDGICGDVFSWWWRQVEQFPLLTPERERQLAMRVRQGDNAAFEEMVESNLRLVVAIARRSHAYSTPSLALIDLVQEGTIGLMKAVRKFDHRRGYKFSTYATYWIRQAIMRSMNDLGRTIRLPTHVWEKVHRAERVRVSLTHSLLRSPDNAEMAHYMDISLDRLQQLFDGACEPLSLDILQEETDHARATTFEDHLADVDAPSTLESALDSVARDLVCDTLRRAMESLPEREAEIISLRYGLDGGPARTLNELAGRYKVSRERIRQLETAGLNRLRDCGTLREVVAEM